MTLALPRRRFLTAALGLLAAPTIVRVSSIMPVRPVDRSPRIIGVDYGGGPLTMMRIWHDGNLVYMAPVKMIDLQLARAT